ncbi:MAG: VPLPA-CTERM sorting domain-containing protein [Gammaproteobacteria bacterium]
MKTVFVLVLATFSLHAAALNVEIRISGAVEFNQINQGELAGANGGDDAEIVFQVSADTFIDSGNFPVRGYEVIAGSFQFTAGDNSVGLADPFPAGQAPYFVIRNNDPAVDGFFLGTNVDGFPNGVPSDSEGLFGAFAPNFSVSYDNDPLPSLDILDALGTYDFAGLTSFNFVVNDGPFDAMGLIFDSMTITAVPVPAAVWLMLGGLASLFGLKRKSRQRNLGVTSS